MSKEVGKESEESKKIMASSKLKTRQHAQGRNRRNLYYFQLFSNGISWKVFLNMKTERKLEGSSFLETEGSSFFFFSET